MFSTPFTFLKFTPSGGGLDPDAQAFLTATGITDPTIETAINTLVVDLKAASLWTKMDAIYPFVGGTSTTCKYNLIDPRDLDAAYRLTFNGGLTYSSIGVTPNGSNGWAETHLLPATLGATSRHLSFYSMTNSAAAVSYELAASDGGSTNAIIAKFINSKFYAAWNTDYNINVDVASSAGYYISTITSGSVVGYKDGVNLLSGSTTISTPSSQTFAIFKEGGYGNYSNRTSSFVSLGEGLSGGEVTTLNTIVEDFQINLGRIVSDPDAQAFLTATGITDTTTMNAINDLVVDLKAASLWTKFYAIYPFVGGTATTTKYNLKDPQDTNAAYRITWNGGITYSSAGVKGNGSNGYGQVYFNPNTLSMTNAHLSVYLASSEKGSMFQMGMYNSGQAIEWGMIANFGNDTFYTQFGGGWKTTTNVEPKGYYISTNDGSTTTAYKNGSSIVSGSQTFGVVNAGMVIMATDNGGSITGFDEKLYEFLSFGTHLTGGESSTLNTIVTAFQTTLSRQN